MMRKRLLLMLGCVAAVLLAGYVTLRLTRHRITKENFEAIQKGMTEEDVVAILGPPGDYYSVFEGIRHVSWSGRDVGSRIVRDNRGKMWRGENFDICVCFDEAGRVIEKLQGSVACARVREPFFDKVRRWLGMQ